MKQKTFLQGKQLMDGDNKYSRAIKVPQYEPSNTKPHIESLCDIKRYSKLISDINKSNVSEEEKRFLRFAASRHIVFNYSKIADYYANSNVDMQRLMEQSALVIIDMDDAIANGYVQLSQRMKELIEDQKRKDANER